MIFVFIFLICNDLVSYKNLFMAILQSVEDRSTEHWD